MTQSDEERICRQIAEGYVTAWIGEQLFGLGLSQVRDVFVPKGLCIVPLAAAGIAGVLSLRGRIVTAIDLRCRLGLPPREAGAASIAIGIERGNELYGLIADAIGDVLRPPPESYEPVPVNIAPRLAEICSGVHRLERHIMLVLDANRILNFGLAAAA